MAGQATEQGTVLALGEVAPAARAPARTPGALALLELLIKDPAEVDRLARSPALAADLVPRLLAVALGCFTVFGVALAVLLALSEVKPPHLPAVRLGDGSPLALILAYDVGFFAACGVCLPSFYFYGLLAGIRVSMVQTVVLALKGLAATGILLVGILPIYAALALGLVVFGAEGPSQENTLLAGLLLPFLAGLFGARSLYLSFLGFADTIREECRVSRRCFLRRLITAWSVCATAVTPVMIYTLWHKFSL